MLIRKFLFALLVAGCFGALHFSAFAEEITLKDGNTLTGTVEKVTDEKVVLSTDSGRAKTRVRFDEMTPETEYRIRNRYRTPESAEEHLELGMFARKHKFFSRARDQIKKARAKAQDTSLKDRADKILNELDQEEAAHLFQKGNMLQEEGKFEEAIRTYQRLQTQFSETRFAERASSRVRKVAKKLVQQIEEGKKQRQKQLQDARKNKEKQLLEQIRKELTLAENQLSRALTLEAAGRGDDAFSQYDAVDERLEGLRHRIQNQLSTEPRPKLKESLNDLKERVKNLLVRSYTQRANLFGVRGQVQQGLKWVNHALSINPSHQQANKLKHIFTEHLLNRSLNGFRRHR